MEYDDGVGDFDNDLDLANTRVHGVFDFELYMYVTVQTDFKCTISFLIYIMIAVSCFGACKHEKGKHQAVKGYIYLVNELMAEETVITSSEDALFGILFFNIIVG